MKYDELTIHTTHIGAEICTGALLASGISCFVTEDKADLESIIKEKSIPYDYIEDSLLCGSDEVLIKVYLPVNEQGRLWRDEIIMRIKALKTEQNEDYGSLEISFLQVDEKDWENNWKQFFHPMQIGKFTVKPSWESCDDGGIIVEIDPASSFGTGQHETTALCLELLSECELLNKPLLDMGCGSGILGIAAHKAGAMPVVCVDIEQTSADTTRENAEKNGISKDFSVFCGNILADNDLLKAISQAKYQIITANIVADVINAMLPMFNKMQDIGGLLICSGIISPRKESVLSSLSANGYKVLRICEKNDWVALLCEKE